MEYLGQYHNCKVYWLDYSNFFLDQFPKKDWVCLAITNSEPDISLFDEFVRTCISNNIAEFKTQGAFGEKLHDLFDDTMVSMKVFEKHPKVEVMTTWHNNETLADVFWQCFFATCLPGTSEWDNIKVICTDLDGVNRIDEFKLYLKEFQIGWLPCENVKHEVWTDEEGKTTLCFADKRGDKCRELLEPGSKLIHCFYASSHYEAMTIYYKFMGWGEYTTEFESDKQPYEVNAT